MKRFCGLIFLVLSFLMMLCFPSKTFIGASNGLILWYKTIFPTLFPFILISNLLVECHAIPYISRICSKFICKLFRISTPASYAVMLGFLCGYPMGAKAINDLVQANYISKNEGKYLLSFCNNSSPMFITSFIITQNLDDTSYTLGTLLILYLAPLLCSFLFRNFYHMPTPVNDTLMQNQPFSFCFETLEFSITNALQTIGKIGGYIVLFSILSVYFQSTPFWFFVPMLELSNGIICVMNWNIPFPIIFILVLSFTSFGGVCAILQTGSVIKNSKIPIFPYIIQKLITAMVTSLLAILYINFIHQ